MEINKGKFFPIEKQISPDRIGLKGNKQQLKTEEERLEEAVSQFTALLFQQMFKAMRGTIPGGGLFKESFAGQVYQGLFDTEVSKMGAEQNYFKALNQQLYRQLNREE